MSANVGIVIVSHSADVARGTAEMVRQMVGDEVSLAFCGGDPGARSSALIVNAAAEVLEKRA